jgi:hypothetical protein
LHDLRTGGVGTYFNDLSTGVTQALNDLMSQAASCPDQEIVLSGYSQGAMVMHRVLHQLGASQAGQQVLSRIAAAVLIADGDQVALDHEVMDGSALHLAFGIGQVVRGLSGTSGAKFGSGLAARVIRVCNMGDLVCDIGTAAGLAILQARSLDLNRQDYVHGVKIHESYYQSKPLTQAAKQAASDAQKLSYFGGPLAVHGTVGSPISASAAVIGGKAPLNVFVTPDGNPPPWLSIGVAGRGLVTLGGVPTAAGSWQLSIEVQDSGNSIVLIPVSLSVS